jgi:DNA-binding SARP family transcriptional activator
LGIVVQNLEPDPTNPILECVVTRQYRRGTTLLRERKQPSAQDLTWGAICLLNDAHPLEAIEPLMMARSAGLEDAAVHLACAWRLAGDEASGTTVLATVREQALSAFGRACLERERGALSYATGALRQSVRELQSAWSLATADPIGRALLTGFNAALGLALSDAGFDERASRHLERGVDASDSVYLHTARVTCALNTGDVLGARRALEEAQALLADAPVAEAMLAYCHARVAHFVGDLEPAASHLTRAIQNAAQCGSQDIEFHARLQLATLEDARGQPHLARAHFARANRLATNPCARAFLEWRRGTYLMRNARPEGLARILEARAAFQRLERDREEGLTYLHVCEACLRHGDEDRAREALEAAVDARHALGNGARFALELRGLPSTQEFLNAAPLTAYERTLLEDHTRLEAIAVPRVKLRTFGTPALLISEHSVRLEAGVARCVELLAYLLETGEASLEHLQRDLYPDVAPSRSRSHIHTIRSAIVNAIPGLSVPFDPEKRTYRVAQHGVRLIWDVLEVRNLLDLQSPRPLRRAIEMMSTWSQPDATAEWIESLHTRLEARVLDVGITIIRAALDSKKGSLAAELALALQARFPLEVNAAVLLVEAILAAEGQGAAMRTLRRLQGDFEREVGDVPERLWLAFEPETTRVH